MKKGTISQNKKVDGSKPIDDINKWAFWYFLARRFSNQDRFKFFIKNVIFCLTDQKEPIYYVQIMKPPPLFEIVVILKRSL